MIASLIAAEPAPAVVLHGTKGTFIKYRGDVQEQQLQHGVKPSDPQYGIETSDKTRSLLVLIDDKGDKIVNAFEEEKDRKASFMDFYEQIYQCLENKSKEFIVKEEHLLKVMEWIEKE